MKYVMMCCFCFLLMAGKAQENGKDAILGKWMYEEKDLIVDVYKQDDDFKAKIVWFHDAGDSMTPIEHRLDVKNPDKDLRDRKIVGMDILSGITYDPKVNKWIKGKIYDSSSGRTWDATVWLKDEQTMEVRGYYIFKFIGKTMKFTRL